MRAYESVKWIGAAIFGAILIIIYLKRVQGIQGLQDLQDGMFALLVLSWIGRFFAERKLRSVLNG